MRVLIVGCGYAGLPLGMELAAEGHEVVGVRRTPPEISGAFQIIGADITNPTHLARLPGPFDWVINTVSAGQSTVENYRDVYFIGTQNLVAWLKTAGIKKYVYTSSTGVYGQIDGSAVKEDALVEPPSETGVVLRDTEKLLLNARQEHGFPAIILRVAGIYGPDRGYWFRQFLAGQARLEGKGDRILNMIHRDDLVGTIKAVLRSGRPGEIYNTVDDEPVAQIHFFRWLSETLGRDMPAADFELAKSERKRGWSNKKVLNRKLKMEVGYRFKYPTFRQGYTAEIQRLENLGLIPPSAT